MLLHHSNRTPTNICQQVYIIWDETFSELLI